VQPEAGIGDFDVPLVELCEHDPVLGVPVEYRRKLEVEPSFEP